MKKKLAFGGWGAGTQLLNTIGIMYVEVETSNWVM
jgi:hypothetical protein